MENKQPVFDADVAMRLYKDELKATQDELMLWKLKFYQLQKSTQQLLDQLEQMQSSEGEKDKVEEDK